MQKIFNIDKWTRLEEGQSIEFLNPRARNVRLEVNAPVKTALHYVDLASGEVHFLALVEGRDSIEFGTIGPYSITVEGPEILVYTADGTDISQKVVAPVIFTKVMERRRRNPELEYIAATMQRNMERNLEKQAAELARIYAARDAAFAAQLAAASNTASTGSQPAPTGGTVAPDTPPPPPGGGSDSGTTGGTTTPPAPAPSGT